MTNENDGIANAVLARLSMQLRQTAIRPGLIIQLTLACLVVALDEINDLIRVVIVTGIC